MTLISPSKTSCLHNIELPHVQESINKLDLLFSEQYISKETFKTLNLRTTLDELKHFAKQGDFSSIDLLFTLTSRCDEIGLLATQILLEIKEGAPKGSHEEEVFTLHCENFYQQCHLNEINHRSPQLCQLSINMLKILMDIMLTGNNTRNQDIFNLIQILQNKSLTTHNYAQETHSLVSHPVSMIEEKGFIAILSTKSQSADNLSNTILQENGHHIMDNTISEISHSELSPYLPLNEGYQDSAAHFMTHSQKIDPISQTRHEFIEFLHEIRKSTYFSDTVMEKLIHKWDVNNPIFIPKPDIESTYSSTAAMTDQHWQSRLSRPYSVDQDTINTTSNNTSSNNTSHTASTSRPPLSQDSLEITHDDIKMDTNTLSDEETTTKPLSEKLSTWFASFLFKK
ncbi:hypothetical protein [uncultured Shewanella sp.]|uniref:hypothetical protein n=1 Tax=uncultured Shewanella sp. TaxID=173975 RepID=UPI002637FEA7|nr:hypothetical protein [uncultured Shewanella sp.]